MIEPDEGIISITLYGSYAKGTNDRNSDIDILIITTRRDRIGAGLSSKIGKEISITQMRPDA